MNKILFACLMLLSLPVLGQDKFYQGPGEIGRRDEVAGTVVGIHPGPGQDCYLLLADIPGSQFSGLGGAGRFFLCGTKQELEMGQHWKGRVIQVDQRLARIGPRWRPVSVFQPR